MKVPSLEVGKQLQVGAGEAKALGKGTEMVRGAAYIEGPMQIGDDEALDIGSFYFNRVCPRHEHVTAIQNHYDKFNLHRSPLQLTC